MPNINIKKVCDIVSIAIDALKYYLLQQKQFQNHM